MARRILVLALLASALVHPSSSTRAQEVGVNGADRVTRYGVMKPPPNVSWNFVDNVTACPAGDTVVAGHPCRLRVTVSYSALTSTSSLAGSVRRRRRSPLALTVAATDASRRTTTTTIKIKPRS